MAIIVFLKHFHRNLLPNSSLPPESIPAYLPEGLAKIYREFGGLFGVEHPNSFFTLHKFVPVSQLHEERGMVDFCSNRSDSWYYSCPINQKDPPVHQYMNSCLDDILSGCGYYGVVCESLDHFLITLCLQEAVHGSRNFASLRNAANIGQSIDILETIIEKEKFQPLWLSGKCVDRDWLSDFYISEDRDILIWNRGGGYVVSQTCPLTDIFDLNVDPKINIYMFGVNLPRRYWTKLSDWQPKWLLDEENAEVRRVLIQQIGYDRICQELDATYLDNWLEYTLLKINAGIDVEPIVLLKMNCPSTQHIHILRVPPEMTSAEDAITWVNHGIRPDEFSVQT